MCKKAIPLAPKPNHNKMIPFKLNTTFHPNRYLKKVVNDIRQALSELDSTEEPTTKDLQFKTNFI